VRAYLQQWLYPKLMAHHRVMLLTPAFGSRCYARAVANHTALPPTICHDLECHDTRAAALVDDYAAWARQDSRVVAISPTFYHGCGYTYASSVSQQQQQQQQQQQHQHQHQHQQQTAPEGGVQQRRAQHKDCFPQVCFPPVSPWDWLDVGFGEAGAMPKTLAGWQAVGRSIVA
jgi:hypothetical protein